MNYNFPSGFFFCLAATSLVSCTGNEFNGETKSRPNILLIMADDLGWSDVGFTGNTIVKTPNLDNLVNQGVQFNHFYSGAPLSSPTRASVLTGRNPFRTGVYSANVGILRPEEIALPEILHDNGYSTGHFGKWHLGTLTYTEVDANRGRPGNTALYNPPSMHGYDYCFVTESKVPTYDPMIQPSKNDGKFWDYIQDKSSAKAYGTSYWDIDGNKVTENLNGDDSRCMVDRVLPFIEASVSSGKPFFGVVWFHAPHLPCVASPEYAQMYKDLPLEERNYFGCISAMDEQIGRIVQYLKDNGLYDNTIITFCSDNGPELETPGTAGNFIGKKRSLHEGGIRVPSFIIWPSHFKAGSSVEECCSTCDYLPTLLEALNIEYPDKNRYLDGQSVLPLLEGREFKRTKPLTLCNANQGAYVEGFTKLYFCDGVYELYDLEKDPYESTDIAADNPEVLKHMIEGLNEQLASFESSFRGAEYGVASYEKVGQK